MFDVIGLISRITFDCLSRFEFEIFSEFQARITMMIKSLAYLEMDNSVTRLLVEEMSV